jgi:DNA-directed RNA polymerase omega subunit
MARVHTAKAAEMADGDPYLLIHMAAKRAKQLQKGARPLTSEVGESHCVTALREIEEGKYTQEHFYERVEVEGLKKEKEIEDEYQSTQSERYPE